MAPRGSKNGAVAEPEAPAGDDLLPTGPEPGGLPDTDAEALARLSGTEPPNADAFVDDDEDADDETLAPPTQLHREPVAGQPPARDSFELINLGFAQLQDIKVSAKSNGNTFVLIFEIGIDQLDKLPDSMLGGHDLTWKKLAVGAGAEVKTFGSTRDADGNPHLKVKVQLPQSEVSRSLGRLGPNVGGRGELLLEPMQGTLPLKGGGTADLTSRAE